jgi:hypothetical protein
MDSDDLNVSGGSIDHASVSRRPISLPKSVLQLSVFETFSLETDDNLYAEQAQYHGLQAVDTRRHQHRPLSRAWPDILRSRSRSPCSPHS